jgi:beta-galactosidase
MKQITRRSLLKHGLVATVGLMASVKIFAALNNVEAATPALKSPPELLPNGTMLDSGKSAAASQRERLLMDAGWKFHLGDLHFDENIINAGVNEGPAGLKFDDSHWRTVNLPHDWAVELPFDQNADVKHGYKPVGPGFPDNSIGWYRRSFALSAADKGKRLYLEFDGVYRKCSVFLNGYKLDHHEGGYNSFRCDISDVADYGGNNVLAVRVDASEDEGWFYEGAGIYRHVWLVKTAPFAIAPGGIFIYSQFPNNVPTGLVQIHLKTKLLNGRDEPADAKVNWRMLAPDGKVAAETEKSETVGSWETKEISATATVSAPILWSPESPKLYKLVTTVESGGKTVDQTETEFGIRTIAFDGTNGFLLNGKPYAIRGTCNHQDHAGVGVAVPDALWNFRVAKLKEMGCNAIRTSHNEPAEELLEACDRLGMLVMDETRNFASDPQSLANLKQQIVRDRNHPSVFIWSLANEEPLHKSNADEIIAITMRRLAHQLDPTRLCTAAVYDWPLGKPYGISAGIDVQGFNYYNQGDTDTFHKNHPDKPSIGTEEGMAQYSRGVYENTRTYLSAYDVQKSYCRNNTAEESIKFYAARPWIAGMFFWTGFDYRGEPSPFNWPNISSDFGILDTCGFPKDVFYYFQSCWTDKPMLHLLPHWNWSDKIGQDIDVWCFSNCKEVELFLNGRSLGKKEMPQNSHLEWKVKYEPGTLSAKGYGASRNVIAESKVETTEAPADIQLTSDRATIHADGEDCSVVAVAVTDAAGRKVPTADILIHFKLSGPGKIIGVGNGDAACHEPDVYFDKQDVRALELSDWFMAKVPDLQNRPEVAEHFDDSQWGKVNVRADDGPLRPGEMAVFRTQVRLSAADLAIKSADLNFGMIDDQGWVYVNGQFAGESHNWNDSPSFDVRKFLHAGDNTIAVAVKNNDGSGGVNKSVSLELKQQPVPANWQRSAFNGLAEVIVQADADAGDIQLMAYGDGLSPTSIIVRAKPSTLRLAVP